MGEVIAMRGGVRTLDSGTIVLDHYQITGFLGSGNRAIVYQGRDMDFPDANIQVAVKGIHPPDDRQHRALKRPAYAREANILLSCNHDTIPKLYEVGTHDDIDYMVIEYVNGSNLNTLLDQTVTLPLHYVIRWGIALCDALGYLHDHEPNPIIYGNVAPENILVDILGEVMLGGWGGARSYQSDSHYGVWGVERYMAPERYHGVISPWTDMFGLGATLHQAITRTDPRQHPPFTFHRRPLDHYDADVPRSLSEIIYIALAMDPDDRFWNMYEMKDALTEVLAVV